ncbi:translational GTPase TypA [Buchnera aphidicola (Mollitrichosiphum nigrofasciatum)]|uniref:translational GTPase TypA n=1 Tax=Buchnera aphidicola TaxID=9 RepID=UPI0031B85E28
MTKYLRNIAIIAHVDHGKTTLVNQLLKQSGAFKKHEKITERVMDSHDLEKERGITIFSKITSVQFKKYHINIVDTPGHADFGGEVERILSMVDSVLLIVDAQDGPMPQTRFVTQKAFLHGIKPIVVINKIDKKYARTDWVIEKIFDLFVDLNATDEQLDFPIIYTSALQGAASKKHPVKKTNMKSLYKAIIKHAPIPKINKSKTLQMQISQLDYSNYLGVIGIGRIKEGVIIKNQDVAIINKNKKITFGKINKILYYCGLKRVEINKAKAGDIIAITGIDNLNISDTICELNNIKRLPKLKVDKPTVNMLFSVNSSPFSSKEGKYITSRHILERLKKESIHNVALKIKSTNNTNTFSVSGRGELHLAILIENMRREGFELEVSRPKIIFRTINNEIQEPYENVSLNIPEKYQGKIIKKIGERRGKLQNIHHDVKNNSIHLEYLISSRALIGFRTEFINLTSGKGLLYTAFSHYEKKEEHNIGQRTNGVLISNNTGMAVAYAIFNLQNKGKLFIKHGEQVYEGQIIGIHNRSNDLTVNCITGKKLTNMRASGSDESIILTPPNKINLEYAISFINDDELVEITPKSIRLRKMFLLENQRKKKIKK